MTMPQPSRDAQSRADRLRHILSGFGPSMPRPRGFEPFRAAFGAGLAIMVVGYVLLSVRNLDPEGLRSAFLVAPMGATALLLFAIPNSPLAQPWPTVVGSALSALVALLVVQLPLPLYAVAGLAVGLAIVLMSLLRALHPPGGAVALLTVLEVDKSGPLGFDFILSPIILDACLLVLAAILWNHATGRVYPFRHPAPAAKPDAPTPAPATAQAQLGLSTDDLAELLRQFNLQANIGPVDFGRVLAAAEEEAANRRFGRLTARQIMTPDPVSVAPSTRAMAVAELFRKHGFKTLPVVGRDHAVLGLISQNDLIQRARDAAVVQADSFASAMGAMLRASVRGTIRAADIMSPARATVPGDMPAGELVPLLADQKTPAVLVTENGRMVGIITRSNVLKMLAHAHAMPLPDHAQPGHVLPDQAGA